jgi:8-oxo-dGTP pyrophosphatase MutT (NUDIX family)
MVERAATMAFAAGALVFPGGAVDDADHDLAARMGDALPRDEAAARIAAIRETIEEAGLGVGLIGAMDAAMVLRLRDGLRDGQPLGALLDRHGLGLDLSAPTPFARWHPAPFEQARRVFDTRFYLARAPGGQVASVDTTENVRLFWSSAADTLALCDAGQGKVIFPTRRNLERLAICGSYADLLAHAAAFPIEKVCPWQEERDGEAHLCIPDHLGYPVTSEPMRQVRRV